MCTVGKLLVGTYCSGNPGLAILGRDWWELGKAATRCHCGAVYRVRMRSRLNTSVLPLRYVLWIRMNGATWVTSGRRTNLYKCYRCSKARSEEARCIWGSRQSKAKRALPPCLPFDCQKQVSKAEVTLRSSILTIQCPTMSSR